MQANNEESILQLLRILVGLFIQPEQQRPNTLRLQIAYLNNLGVRPAEIAKILGKTGSHINKELTGIRKQRKSK